MSHQHPPAVILLLAVSAVHMTQGMQCNFPGVKEYNCPRLLQNENLYCCLVDSQPTCCNFSNFILNFICVQHPSYFIGGLIGASIVIAWVLCCRCWNR